MLDTRYKRIVVLAVTGASLLAAPAGAAEIPVLGSDGGITERRDPGVAVRDLTVPPGRPHRGGRALTAQGAAHARKRARATKARTAKGELQRLLAAGAIDQPTATTTRKAYDRAKSLGRRLSGRRGLELRGVVGIVDGIAARGELTASRLPAITLMLQRNAEWWGGDGSLLASGVRVSFEGSELVWQSVPGQGIQFHPLANFGKLNQLWREKASLSATRMNQLLDELLALRAGRAGGTAWEYYYAFDGGKPPWVSSLSQGTGLQSTARAATKALRPDVLAQLEQGLAIFETKPPQGVKTSFGGGSHYAQYSFWPSLRIANGFAQSLVGLYDYAQLTGSQTASRLFTEGERSAAADLPSFDTGAWSLYSRGAITRESDLNYHGVLIDFLKSLCDRTGSAVYCDLVTSFTEDEAVAPTLSLVTRNLRAGASGKVQVRLSKISRVRLQLRRGGKLVYDSSTVQGYGTRSWAVTPPRTTRRYDVTVTATDLAGNAAEPVEGTITVLKPRSRK